MTWCNISISDPLSTNHTLITSPSSSSLASGTKDRIAISSEFRKLHAVICPSCGHHISLEQEQVEGRINDLPGLPAGVKFDPTDSEILEHLEGKIKGDLGKLHPLLDEFIPTIEGENGICYTHPEKLPGLSKNGAMRHFFHRPSKAYTTGMRKRRKVNTDEGGETRWHKTGKTRPILINGVIIGFKKILVLYTNYGRQKKPEKTNWVMHQYHHGENEDEKDGEFVLSKVFYQTQPRQCGSNIKELTLEEHHSFTKGPLNYYQPSFNIPYVQNRESSPKFIPNLVAQDADPSLVHFTTRK